MSFRVFAQKLRLGFAEALRTPLAFEAMPKTFNAPMMRPLVFTRAGQSGCPFLDATPPLILFLSCDQALQCAGHQLHAIYQSTAGDAQTLDRRP